MTPALKSNRIPDHAADRIRLRRLVEHYASEQALDPPLSIEELRDHARRACPDEPFTEYVMILLNNAVWRETVASIPYTRRLLLLPQCLRPANHCPAQMDEFGLLCAECGQCPIGKAQSLAEQLGYVVLVAEGSSVVARLLEGGKIDAVIGVSCLDALEKSFPRMADGAIPGLAIPLTRDGCAGTQTDPAPLREAILLKSDAPWSNQIDTRRLREIVLGWFTGFAPAGDATATEQIAWEWLLQGGKRWRPYLLACAYSALRQGTTDLPGPIRELALAIECFHKASLIHDDIEDQDDLRDGKPTLHHLHGIPVAINAGDFLVGEGYRRIAALPEHTAALLRVAADAHRTLCLGQGEELLALSRGDPVPTRDLFVIFRHKTAPSFGAALQMGAVAAGADDQTLESLRRFSESLGIAYQIRDDLDEFLCGSTPDLRASILSALARDQGIPMPPPGKNGRIAPDRGLRDRMTEMMIPEKAAQWLAHYKREAIRALNPLENALLKSLLRRIATSMLNGPAT